MTIDIISYTPEQYAVLSSKALEEIRTAQRKKDALKAALNKRLETEKQKMIDRGCYLSNVWSRLCDELQTAYEKEVEIVRDNLLFFLHYADDVYSQGAGGANAPYPVDYSLSVEDRVLILKEYYTSTYTDATVRFNAFNADTFARSYLEELYASLWHYFEYQTR